MAWLLPQGQANLWIRNMEASRKLLVLKPATDPNYLRQLAAVLPAGTPVLLEGLGERLDASLEPVLLKQTFKSVSPASPGMAGGTHRHVCSSV